MTETAVMISSVVIGAILLATVFVVLAVVVAKLVLKAKEYSAIAGKLSTYLDRDETRMQLLNDALLKLAAEAAASRESVDQIKLLVTDAAGGNGVNTMDKYNQAFAEFKGQGFDEGESHRQAAEFVIGGMVGEI